MKLTALQAEAIGWLAGEHYGGAEVTIRKPVFGERMPEVIAQVDHCEHLIEADGSILVPDDETGVGWVPLEETSA